MQCVVSATLSGRVCVGGGGGDVKQHLLPVGVGPTRRWTAGFRITPSLVGSGFTDAKGVFAVTGKWAAGDHTLVVDTVPSGFTKPFPAPVRRVCVRLVRPLGWPRSAGCLLSFSEELGRQHCIHNLGTGLEDE